jgi:hypothetical protein
MTILQMKGFGVGVSEMVKCMKQGRDGIIAMVHLARAQSYPIGRSIL